MEVGRCGPTEKGQVCGATARLWVRPYGHVGRRTVCGFVSEWGGGPGRVCEEDDWCGEGIRYVSLYTEDGPGVRVEAGGGRAGRVYDIDDFCGRELPAPRRRMESSLSQSELRASHAPSPDHKKRAVAGAGWQGAGFITVSAPWEPCEARARPWPRAGRQTASASNKG